MINALEKLIDFHKSFEINIEKNPIIPGEARCKLRQKLLEEEVNELKTAWKSEDIIEVADALADIQYVLLGTVLEFGLQDYFSDLFNEVHRSNMTKLDENGKPLRRSDGKVIKSELYKPPRIDKIFKNKMK